MKIILISEDVKNNIKEKVLEVLEEKIDILEIDTFYPSIIVDFLEELGIEIDLGDDMDTNGWDWDYWIKFRYKNRFYCLCGSGYYGGLKIFRDTDAERDYYDDEQDDLTEKQEEYFKDIVDLLKKTDEILNKE